MFKLDKFINPLLIFIVFITFVSGVRAEDSKRGFYLTAWTAANKSTLRQAIKLLTNFNLNSVVIDLKDYSGYVFFKTNNNLISGYNTLKPILSLQTLTNFLHQNNIYVIGRIVVFQDNLLPRKINSFAVKNKNNELWLDNKNITWIEPFNRDYWQYIVEISKEALAQGIDEINLDYVRFPTDGNLRDIVYSQNFASRRDVIKEFLRFVNENIKKSYPDKKISLDIFGLTLIAGDNDLGIGQTLEDALTYSDYVMPMLYPSHFAKGFYGYQNPAEYPYEVIHYSLSKALSRFPELVRAKLRPWFQAFNIGAIYDSEKVYLQIKAFEDLNLNNGWFLWNSSNIYDDKLDFVKYPKIKTFL